MAVLSSPLWFPVPSFWIRSKGTQGGLLTAWRSATVANRRNKLFVRLNSAFHNVRHFWHWGATANMCGGITVVLKYLKQKFTEEVLDTVAWLPRDLQASSAGCSKTEWFIDTIFFFFWNLSIISFLFLKHEVSETGSAVFFRQKSTLPDGFLRLSYLSHWPSDLIFRVANLASLDLSTICCYSVWSVRFRNFWFRLVPWNINTLSILEHGEISSSNIYVCY
jgi:hypothetical protein